MDNITDFPTRDLVKEMTGPKQSGCSVIIDGRLVPNMVMYDRGETIDFVLDGRMCWPFPREIAWQAASFAFASMAIGAGFAHPSANHFTQRSFAPECIGLGEIPK